MAVQTEPITGVYIASFLQGTKIGAQTDGTLTASQDVREIITKQNSGFIEHLSGKQDWSASHSGLALDDAGSKMIANGNASLELEFDDTDDGTENPNYHVVESLESIEASLQQNLAKTGGLDKELYTYRRPAERMIEVSTEGSYLDPASDPGAPYEEIWRAKDNADVVVARLTIGPQTYEMDLAPGEVEISAATGGEDATISVTFMSDGEVTRTGTAFDSSVSMILDAFFNQTLLTLALQHVDDAGAPVTGSTIYKGDAYLDTATLSVTDGEEITLDGEFSADGHLERNIVS